MKANDAVRLFKQKLKIWERGNHGKVVIVISDLSSESWVKGKLWYSRYQQH